MQNAYDFLKTQNIDDEDIYIIGQSLGTGIVVDFAFKNQNFKNPIMLISPYKTLDSVVLDDESSCSSIKKTLDMFETKDKIDKIEAPCKIVHGYNDELINISHGKELFSMVKNKLEPVWLHSTGHNDILFMMNDQIYIDFLNHI
jgi:esterase/lipase